MSLREALNSSFTRDAYERRLVQFFRDVGFKADDFVAKAKNDPQWAQRFITDYMLRQKQRVLNKEIEASSLSKSVSLDARRRRKDTGLTVHFQTAASKDTHFNFLPPSLSLYAASSD